MQPTIDILTANVDMGALAVLLVFVPILAFFSSRAKSGHRFSLRPIPAYSRISRLLSQAIESGQSLHIGMGSGQIGGKGTAESIIALTVFDFVARRAATVEQPLLGTAGNATILAAAQGVLHAARRRAGSSARATGTAVQFAGPDPLAYAAGASAAAGTQPNVATVLLGQYHAEGLWLAETLRTNDAVQLGGTPDPSGAMLMSISLDEAVIGEDVFAAGAYLHRPSHLGSLAAQDMMRLIVILSILVGAVLASLGS